LDRIGNDNFEENCAVFFLAAKDRNRGKRAVYDCLLTGTHMSI
jgi:hypothetical protein